MSHATHRLPPSASRSAYRRPAMQAPAACSTSPAVAEVLRNARAIGDAEEHTDVTFNAAIDLYEAGHWPFAFERLATIADQGHAPAAKLALLMLRYGTALYGSAFSARPEQVARWAQRVLRASSRATASPSSITASA
jgi:hypothetical protein